MTKLYAILGERQNIKLFDVFKSCIENCKEQLSKNKELDIDYNHGIIISYLLAILNRPEIYSLIYKENNNDLHNMAINNKSFSKEFGLRNTYTNGILIEHDELDTEIRVIIDMVFTSLRNDKRLLKTFK